MTQQEAVKEIIDYAVMLNVVAESQREVKAIQCCSAKAVEVIMRLATVRRLCATSFGQCEYWDKRATGCKFCTEDYKERNQQ